MTRRPSNVWAGLETERSTPTPTQLQHVFNPKWPQVFDCPKPRSVPKSVKSSRSRQIRKGHYRNGPVPCCCGSGHSALGMDAAMQ
eukprot:6237914-Amphidinium_carterae.1